MSMKLPQSKCLEPYYEIYFNNSSKPIDDKLKRYITLVEFEESDSEADLVRITVSDKDLLFSNTVGLTKKMPVRVKMGFKGNLREVMNGTVSHIEADFGEEGIPSLVIGVVDSSNVMATKKKSRKWTKQRASTVVAQIAREYGLTPVVTTTPYVIDEITQEDETDAQLLMRLADDEGFQCYIVPASKKLYFGDRVVDSIAKDTIYYNKGDNTVRYFRPNFVEKNKAENTQSTESDVSDVTGDTINKTATASSNGIAESGSNINSGSSSSSSSSSSGYTINPVTGALERVR